jgi:hypothetical protein
MQQIVCSVSVRIENQISLTGMSFLCKSVELPLQSVNLLIFITVQEVCPL